MVSVSDVDRRVFSEVCDHISGSNMQIFFHHFKRRMPENRLQSVEYSVRVILDYIIYFRGKNGFIHL